MFEKLNSYSTGIIPSGIIGPVRSDWAKRSTVRVVGGLAGREGASQKQRKRIFSRDMQFKHDFSRDLVWIRKKPKKMILSFLQL